MIKKFSHLQAIHQPLSVAYRALRVLKLSLCMAVCGVSIWAYAAPVTTVIAHDSFEYANDITIVGQSGGTGWSSAWLSASPSFNDFSTNAVGLSVPGITGSGGKLVFKAQGTQINDAARNLPLQNSGVVFIRFLSQFGTQSGGGTPNMRLTLSGALTGGIGNNGACGSPVYAILDATLQPVVASCSAVSLSTLSAVVLRIDYTANNTRMWVLSDLTGFDYLNPPAPSAEYTGIAPAFDRIDLYSRSPASIDELQVFRVSSAIPAFPVPSTSPVMLATMTLLLLLASIRLVRRWR